MSPVLPATAPVGTQDDLHALAEWQREVRDQFPILVAHPGTAYLDSAATAQKPQLVLDSVQRYLVSTNANAGRGTYTWANRTTAMLDETRARIRAFVRDPDPERSGVHLTTGTTAGLRTIAMDWLPRLLVDGDEIVVPFADHQANVLPWLEAQELLRRQGIRIVVRELPYEPVSYDYDVAALASMVGPRTRFVAVTHVHHVYGAHMNVDRIRRAVGPDVVICLDAAQSVGHMAVSVAELDVDFLVFSGHKAMALPGTGAIWSRDVRGPAFVSAGWDGSPNTVGAASLLTALDWLEQAGLDRIERWTVACAARLTEGLRHLPAYEVLGCQASLAADSPVQQRQGVVSFRHHGVSSHDLGFVLAGEGFLVRADGHCQGRAGETDSSVRVSTHAYTTVAEIDRLLTVLNALAGGVR